MAKFIGIKITQPSKDVFGSIKPYETQMQSSLDSLVGVDSGESSTPIFHGRKGVIPLVLTSEIDFQGRRHALSADACGITTIFIYTEKFYRIFENATDIVT